MDKQEAVAQLAVLVALAEQALTAAEDFADEHKLGFSFDPAYGMGGYYGPDDDPDEYSDNVAGENRWFPSSQSC